jgi:HEAT repeat protein
MIRQKGKESIREAVRQLDEKLWHQLEEVWRKAEEGIQEAQRSPDGHQQGTAHCLAVEENLSALIPDEWKGDRLTATDLFVLSAAAALHDAGKAGDTLDDHGHVAMREVRARAQDFGLDEGQAEVVGWIVQAHNDGNLEALPPTPRFLGTAEVDMRTLAALFKLADMLHTEYMRVSRQVVDFGGARGEDNPKTLFRLRVRGWGYNSPECILIQAVAKDKNDIEIISTGFEMMRRDLKSIAPALQAAGFPHEFALAVDDSYLRQAAEAERRAERAFVGMDFFREADAPRFKGRKEDIERLYRLILSVPVALLVGDSGVGKTSLIHAGLFPLLPKTGWHFASARPFTDPTANVVLYIGEQLLEGARSEGIVATLEELARHYKPGNVLIVLDQFEDVTRVPRPEMLDDLRRALVAVQAGRFHNLHLLLAYRTDADAGVGPLFQAVAGSPQGLPRHYLQPLTHEGAREALQAGFAEAQVGVDAKGGPDRRPILDVILDDIEAQGRGFYPPYLQMVGETLCLAAQATADKIVTAALYSEKGGAKKIIGEYLFNRLKEFGEREEKAKRVLVALVRSTGIRGQRSFAELQAEVKLDSPSLTQLLHDLVDKRMIRHLGSGPYEIIHDYLAQLVDQKVVDDEVRRFKHAWERLEVQAAPLAYGGRTQPLFLNDAAELYLFRDRIAPNDNETKLLLCGCLMNGAPGWYWLKKFERPRLCSLIKDALAYGGLNAQAIIALAKILGPDAIPYWRKMLVDTNPNVRRAGVNALAQAAGRDALTDFRQMLKDDNDDVWTAAREALVKTADQEDIPYLRAMLDDGAWEVREAAIRALARVAERQAIADLRMMLGDKKPDVARAAGSALIDVVGPEDIPDLEVELKDKAVIVKQVAILALAKLKGKDAIPQIQAMLRRQPANVKTAARIALARVAEWEDTPRLLKMLRDQDTDVMNSAAKALVQVAKGEDVPHWQMRLADRDSVVRQVAVLVLAEKAGPDAISDLRKALEDKDAIVRKLAVNRLAEVARRQALPDLWTQLDDEDSGVVDAAAQAIARIVTREDAPDLKARWEEGGRVVRRVAALALARIADPVDIPLLKEMLTDRDGYVRQRAIEALARVGGRDEVPSLLSMLQDRDSDVRKMAAKAIAQLGAEEELDRLAGMVVATPWFGETWLDAYEALMLLDRNLYCPFEWPEEKPSS